MGNAGAKKTVAGSAGPSAQTNTENERKLSSRYKEQRPSGKWRDQDECPPLRSAPYATLHRGASQLSAHGETTLTKTESKRYHGGERERERESERARQNRNPQQWMSSGECAQTCSQTPVETPLLFLLSDHCHRFTFAEIRVSLLRAPGTWQVKDEYPTCFSNWSVLQGTRLTQCLPVENSHR